VPSNPQFNYNSPEIYTVVTALSILGKREAMPPQANPRREKWPELTGFHPSMGTGFSVYERGFE